MRPTIFRGARLSLFQPCKRHILISKDFRLTDAVAELSVSSRFNLGLVFAKALNRLDFSRFIDEGLEVTPFTTLLWADVCEDSLLAFGFCSNSRSVLAGRLSLLEGRTASVLAVRPALSASVDDLEATRAGAADGGRRVVLRCSPCQSLQQCETYVSHLDIWIDYSPVLLAYFQRILIRILLMNLTVHVG